MAQFTFTNNTYAGEALAGFMASTLLEADSVKRGLLTVINDVKSRKIILDVDDDVVLQNPSGLFTDQGTTAQQTESYLDPVVYEFMKQEQWDKLAQSWEAQALKPGAFLDYEGIVDLSDFMVQRYLTKIQIANERLYWLGKSATKEAAFSADFAGLLPIIAAASGVYKVDLGKSATSMAATAIDASGIVTVADTASLRDGDVVTITGVTGSSKDTTNGAPGINVQGQSYFIKVASATSFKLVRNFNEVNTRKPARNAHNPDEVFVFTNGSIDVVVMNMVDFTYSFKTLSAGASDADADPNLPNNRLYGVFSVQSAIYTASDFGFVESLKFPGANVIVADPVVARHNVFCGNFGTLYVATIG